MALVKPRYALLIIDMINDFEFTNGDRLYPHAFSAAKNIMTLKKRMKENSFPVIYVNDNYGRWQSDFRHLVSHCIDNEVRGQAISKMLAPDPDDYFVLKPQFSGFFATPLELLLTHLKADTLILTGVTGNMCVQFTANDAYMREYKLAIPSDCVASETIEINEKALHLMEHVVKANIEPAFKLPI